MNTIDSQAKIDALSTLIQKAYDLVEYTRSKRDASPYSLAHDDHPGHVHNDQDFCMQREKLKSDVMQVVEAEWGVIERQRLQSQLEHITLSVPPGHSPGWKGLTRCRCWWDTKDELEAIGEHLHGLKLRLEEANAENMHKNPPSNKTRYTTHSPWRSGSFYLIGAILLILVLVFTHSYVGTIGLPIVIIGVILLIAIIGALQLRQDQNLSEENFLSLMLLVYRQIPFLLKQRSDDTIDEQV